MNLIFIITEWQILVVLYVKLSALCLPLCSSIRAAPVLHPGNSVLVRSYLWDKMSPLVSDANGTS